MSRHDMLGRATEELVKVRPSSLGTLVDLLKKMVDDPDTWDRTLKLTIRGQNPYPDKPGAKVKAAASGLFEVIRRVKLTELDEFRPADKFVAMSDEKDRAKALASVGYVDPALQTLMDKIGVESARKPITLTIRKTNKEATFGQMLAELPMRAKKVSLGQVWQMIEKQGQGQEGDLLVDGRANFFLIEGTDLVLYCFWSPGYRYWRFFVCSTSNSRQWNAVHQFLS